MEGKKVFFVQCGAIPRLSRSGMCTYANGIALLGCGESGERGNNEIRLSQLTFRVLQPGAYTLVLVWYYSNQYFVLSTLTFIKLFFFFDWGSVQ